MSSHIFGCPCQDDQAATCCCDKIFLRDARVEIARLRDDRDRWKAIAELWRAADHYGKLIQATPCADGGRYLASARAANGGRE